MAASVIGWKKSRICLKSKKFLSHLFASKSSDLKTAHPIQIIHFNLFISVIFNRKVSTTARHMLAHQELKNTIAMQATMSEYNCGNGTVLIYFLLLNEIDNFFMNCTRINIPQHYLQFR